MLLHRMVHGLLQDRQQEFFIQRTTPQAGQEQASSSSTEPADAIWHGARQDEYNAAEWHNGFQVSSAVSHGFVALPVP